MKDTALAELLDRIERVLARAGERWLDPDTGDEFIRATWLPRNADTEQVCFSRRDKDGAVIVLNPIDMPFCRISGSGKIEPKTTEAIAQIVEWLDALEASLDEK